MNTILIYSRPQKTEAIAEQTANLLVEQLQHLGMQVEMTHSLNLPRLILNNYNTVHLIVQDLPLNVNEVFHLAVCKALGKSTILSVLNSDKKPNRDFLNFAKPDAFSVSQTNHLKLYRNVSANKFIFSGFPKADGSTKKSSFKQEAYLIPLQQKLDEVLQFKIDSSVYFDGRKLLKKQNSAQLRKKWNELINTNKISGDFHLILSESKLQQLLNDESLAVVVADPSLKHTEFITWLNHCMNKNNLIVLNEYQATGFSNYWTSGQNCQVIACENWAQQLEAPEKESDLIASVYKSSELFEPTVNELSRLYSKLWHQKTSLLTSGSVKL